MRLFLLPEAFLQLRNSLVLGMSAGVNDSIHVQVEVVELHAIRVGLADVHWYFDTIHLTWLEHSDAATLWAQNNK